MSDTAPLYLVPEIPEEEDLGWWDEEWVVEAGYLLDFLGNKVLELRLNKSMNLGWFGNPLKVIQTTEKVRDVGRQIYVTLQDLKPEILNASRNERSTQASDVRRITNILFDFDAKIPVSGIPSSDEEHEAALAAAGRAAEYLVERGWPEPLRIDSGNGGQLFFNTDLEPTKENDQLIKAALRSVGDVVGWLPDPTVTNPSRVVGLPGTWNRKGEDTPKRPHRKRHVISAPEELLTDEGEPADRWSPVITAEMLQALAGPVSEPRERVDRFGDFDLENWFAEQGVEYQGPRIIAGGGDAFDVVCPNEGEHSTEVGTSSSVLRAADGALSYVCLHAHCEDWTWARFRAEYEPGYTERAGAADIGERAAPILEALEKQLGITVGGTDRFHATFKKTWATVYRLSDCPFYPGEDHDAAALYIWDDGGFSFRCLAGSCTNPMKKTIDDLGELLELEIRAITVPGVKEADGHPRLRTILAVDVVPEILEFAWDKRIVLQNLNLILANEKMGKGLLLVALSKLITSGELTGSPETVAIASTEEHIASVIRPRLEVAGVDLTRVHLIRDGLGLPEAIGDLRAAIEENEFKWLFLDPINAHFSDDYDPDNKKHVRLVLQKLVDMTKVVPVTILGAIHTNRMKSVEARDIQAHSQEFGRIARSTVLLGRLKDSEDDERVIVHAAANYARLAASQLATIAGVEFAGPDGKSMSVGRIDLDGPSDAIASDLISHSVDPVARAKELESARQKKDEMAAEILAIWEQAGRPSVMESWLIFRSLEAKGFDKRGDKNAIDRGRKYLKPWKGIVVTTERQTPPRGSLWHFEQESDEEVG